MTEERERVLSVFQLAQGLKRTVEDATAGFWVEGEIGQLTRAGSGHIYLTLKDERRDASVDCVMYRREATRFEKYLEQGARVQLRGRASFYPPRGRLQWIAEVARPTGQGALLEAFEKLKQKIIDEGLTDPERKRALPEDPQVVGVVTSGSGAAFHDICIVAARRGSLKIILAPALVQGDEAPRSIIAAMDLIERMNRLDVLIVGRGGGSQEDLMAFNDEAVVRRIAACRVPVVSAVGHEVDTSLSDLVADARAATPSQAAEMVVPDEFSRRERLTRTRRHLAQVMSGRLSQDRARLESARRRLGDPRYLIAERQQRLDELRGRLAHQLRDQSRQQRRRVSELTQRLSARHPRAVLSAARAELSPLQQRLVAEMKRQLQLRGSALGEASHSLSALSPLSVLGRGYALATTGVGTPIRRAADLNPGQVVTVKVEEGAFVAEVKKTLSGRPEERLLVEKRAAFEHESSAAGPGKGAAAGDDDE